MPISQNVENITLRYFVGKNFGRGVPATNLRTTRYVEYRLQKGTMEIDYAIWPKG